MSEWWTMQQAAWTGALGGSLLGVLGGLIGAGAGMLAPRGRARGLVLGSMAAMVVLGLALLTAGLIAVGTGQPYHVWYPLCLLGGIMTMVVGPLIPVVRARYRAAEQRRMDAEQLRRG